MDVESDFTAYVAAHWPRLVRSAVLLGCTRAEAEDVDYLLESLNFYFPAAGLAEGDVVSTFAGLRPLVASARPEAPSEVSREDALFESVVATVLGAADDRLRAGLRALEEA